MTNTPVHYKLTQVNSLWSKGPVGVCSMQNTTDNRSIALQIEAIFRDGRVEVTDAENPRNNQVSIGKVAADASLYNLLLVKAGKERLAEEIDKQIEKQIGEKLGDKAPSGIKDMIKKPKDLIKGLGGLLGGKEKE